MRPLRLDLSSIHSLHSPRHCLLAPQQANDAARELGGAAAAAGMELDAGTTSFLESLMLGEQQLGAASSTRAGALGALLPAGSPSGDPSGSAGPAAAASAAGAADGAGALRIIHDPDHPASQPHPTGKRSARSKAANLVVPDHDGAPRWPWQPALPPLHEADDSGHEGGGFR